VVPPAPVAVQVRDEPRAQVNPSSTVPSQSSSAPLQVSAAPTAQVAFQVHVVPLQVWVPAQTIPPLPEASHVRVDPGRQVIPAPSSVRPLQSSSMPLQISGANG
jgi:hypothetical protein